MCVIPWFSALEDALKSKKLASFLESMDISTQEPADLAQFAVEIHTRFRRERFFTEVRKRWFSVPLG